jgi:non-specific serine/threonine protein kinase
LAAALFWFWTKRGYLGEGREWLERALAASSGASSALRAKAFNGLGLIISFLGDAATSHRSLEQGLAFGREADDQAAIAWSLGLDALVVVLTGGDAAHAAKLAADCQAAAIASGELWRQGPALSCLAHLAMREGDYDRACRLTEEALTLFRRTGDKWAIEQHLSDLAFFRLVAGDYAQAEAQCAEGIALGQELADQLMTGYFMAMIAGARAAQGYGVGSVRLWGAMERLFESVGTRLDDVYENAIGDRYVNPLKQSLGGEAFDAALSEGRAMSLTQAVQYALAKTARDRVPNDASRRDRAE